jgi:Zn-dependent alcohol dehydrogenase
MNEARSRISGVAAGLCHSDEHLRTGDIPVRFPIVGGHEGAGIVEEVGPGVSRLAPGDHIVCSFLPVCGHCRFCSRGLTNLCDLGLAGPGRKNIQLPSFELTLFQKRIEGVLFGGGNPFDDIPLMIEMYRSGRLKLDELITSRYRLEDVNQGYQDLLDGKNVRGVMILEH